MRPLVLFGIYREAIFSPGKIRQDAAILDTALLELFRRGYKTEAIHVEEIDDRIARADLVLSMAQSDHVLTILQRWQETGIRILNSIGSIRNCYRKALIALLADADVPMPLGKIVSLEEVERFFSCAATGCYWLKRGDVHAVDPSDVVRISCREQLVQALDHFHKEKIDPVLIQEHVDGETIKFYGVGNGCYFRAFVSASGDEITTQAKPLATIARQAATVLGLEVYGGDAILTPDGNWLLIDMNDWPSFSTCRHSAAEGIAEYVHRMVFQNDEKIAY